MREPILKAVAMPPRIFWAPMKLFLVNFSLQAALMLVGIAVLGMSPLWVLWTFLISHVIIVAYGAKDPHLSNLMLAWGRNGPAVTKNIYPSRGNKFAP